MTRTLDLRELTEARRESSLTNLLELLSKGESFTLLNNADPKPLFKEFESGARSDLKLEYLETGPSAWRLKVTKVESKEEDDEGCCGLCS